MCVGVSRGLSTACVLERGPQEVVELSDCVRETLKVDVDGEQGKSRQLARTGQMCANDLSKARSNVNNDHQVGLHRELQG